MEILPHISQFTRGLNSTLFEDKKKLWFQGPLWLRESEHNWPLHPTTLIHKELYETLQMKITVNVGDNPKILNIIDMTRYGTLNCVLSPTLLIHFTRIWMER